MKRKLLGVLLCAAVTTTMFAGCGDGGSDAKSTSGTSEVSTSGSSAKSESGDDGSASGDMITVGFAQVGHESDWRTASTKSCQDVFSKENGYDLQFVDCDNDSAVQLEAVRNFIEQDVDYIIIDPIVSTGWDTVLTECEDAGIPVIVIDRTIDDSDKYAAWVGSNFKTEGVAAGEWLKAYAAEKGISEINALVIEGSTGASATIGRTDGFKEVADREGWTILDSQSGDFTQDGGQEVMESYIKSYEGKFNVVICQNDNEAFGAIDAIHAAGKTCGPNGDIIVVSFDSVKAAFESMIKGDLNATFECNPLHGPRVAEIIQKLEKGEEVEKIQYVDEAYFDTSMDLEEILKTRAY